MSLQRINTSTYSPGFQNGQYHNAVLCISGNIHSIYLNGVLISSTTTSSNILTNYAAINQLLVGCTGTKSNGFTGYLDDFRIYNYGMNTTQITSLFSNRNNIAYYTFDTSSNGNVANHTSLIYDGELFGNTNIVTTSGNYRFGTGALSINNTTTRSYMKSNSSFVTSNRNGIAISLWFKATGISGTRMRLFDLCTALGSQGISVDISGTNGIVASYSTYIPPIIINTTPIDYAVYYPFNYSSGTSVLNGVTNAFDGTLINGASISTTKYITSSSSLSLNSSLRQHVVLPTFTNTGSQVSISIWYNQSSTHSGYPYMYSFENGAGTYIGAYINANSRLLTCFVNSGNVQNVYTGTLNVWTYFVWVINGNRWTVYINGVATSYTNASTLSSTSMARRVNIGCTQRDTVNFFYGYYSFFLSLYIVKHLQKLLLFYPDL